ncbi:hypothetical protein JOB18_009086 [Solea senegalensis]|uniref:Uncharacterized protein n=1 Tax=Solea senegalensis TaxID=28829 RepID=A0AAV6SF26_SOLSE|nr:hypothetical protein JOB18_009086 [Solea senegalensis]
MFAAHKRWTIPLSVYRISSFLDQCIQDDWKAVHKCRVTINSPSLFTCVPKYQRGILVVVMLCLRSADATEAFESSTERMK